MYLSLLLIICICIEGRERPRKPVVVGYQSFPWTEFASELERKAGGGETAKARCLNTIEADGAGNSTQIWAKDLCRRRYIFVGGLHHTGTGLLRHIIAQSPVVAIHSNVTRDMYQDEGQFLQTLFRPVSGRRYICGCKEAGCWYYCPAILANVTNAARQQLSDEWFGPRHPTLYRSPVVLEKTPDLLLLFRMGLFPGGVSTYLLPIAHPLCEHATVRFGDHLLPHLWRRHPYRLEAWRNEWMALLEQAVAYPGGGNVYVVRLEDIADAERGPMVASKLYDLLELPHPAEDIHIHRVLHYRPDKPNRVAPMDEKSCIDGLRRCQDRSQDCNIFWESIGPIVRAFGYGMRKDGNVLEDREELVWGRDQLAEILSQMNAVVTRFDAIGKAGPYG